MCVLKSKLWFKGLIRTILRGNRPSFLRRIEQWKYIVEYNNPTSNSSINMNIMFDEYFKPKNKSYNLILIKSLSLFIFYYIWTIEERSTLMSFFQNSWCLVIIEWIDESVYSALSSCDTHLCGLEIAYSKHVKTCHRILREFLWC